MADGIGRHLPRGPGRILKATVWSLQGLSATWRHESSFRTWAYLLAAVVPLALWLSKTGVERALLIGCYVLVLVAEIINSAIEALIERYGNEHHELAGRAKDMGSAAVFALFLNTLVVWALVLWPDTP